MTRSPRAMTELYQRLSVELGIVGVVKGGDEVPAGRPCRRPGAPGRGAAAGMDDVDAETSDQHDPARPAIAAHDQRVLRGERQGQMSGAGARDLIAFHRAAGRGDIRSPAGRGQARPPTRPCRARPRPKRGSGRPATPPAGGLPASGVLAVAGMVLSSADSFQLAASPPMTFARDYLARHDGATIAYRRLAGAAPGIVFLGGFALQHDRHQGAVSRRILPPPRPRLMCASIISGTASRAAISPTARSAAGPRMRSRSSIS